MPDSRQPAADSFQPQSRGPAGNPSRLAVWGICLLALAMAAALASEAVRAAVRERAFFVLPPLIGFALAVMTIRALRAQVGPRACPGLNEWKLAQRRAFLPVLLLIPIALQVLLIYFVRTQPTSDWASYWHSAGRLLSDGEYVCDLGSGLEFRAFKPPGMAAYLALVRTVFGESVIAAQCLNSLLILAGNVLFYVVIRRRFGQPAAACATTLYALWPSRILSAALLSYDAPGSFMVLAMWWLADHRGRGRSAAMAGAGVAAGLAAMLRQPLLLLPLALIVSRTMMPEDRRRLIKDAFLCALGLAVILGPWTYRNYRVLGAPVITSTLGGPTLYLSFHPQAGRYYTSIGWNELAAEFGRDEIELNKRCYRRGLEFVTRDPLAAGVRVLRNLHRLFESDHEIAGLVFDTPGGSFSPRVYQIARAAACGASDVWYAWLALTTLLAAAMVLRRRIPLSNLHWPLLAIATAVVVHGIFVSQPRYFVLYQCFWALLAASVLQASLKSSRQVGNQPD